MSCPTEEEANLSILGLKYRHLLRATCFDCADDGFGSIAQGLWVSKVEANTLRGHRQSL